MSKILPASCNDLKVTCEGVEITTAIILSEGNGTSTGILIIQDDKCYYIPSTAFDLKLLIEKMASVLGQIQTALTNIDTNNYLISSGPDVHGGPKAATQIAAIGSAISDLNTFKGDLD